MKCPACDIPLVVIEREGVELDWCLDCRGLWFDEGELDLLGEKTGREIETEHIGRIVPDEERTDRRDCPRCHRPMEQVRLEADAEVRVDRCSSHGVWFDRGELGALMRLYRSTPGSADAPVLRFLGETFEAGAVDAAGEGRDS
jgi:Zn-finger nucleic acid-binding protein